VKLTQRRGSLSGFGLKKYRARTSHLGGFVFLITFSAAVGAQSSDARRNPRIPEVKLIGSANLPGSFVSSQMVYADRQRIFACSTQGDLFVLDRNRETNFQLLETIHLGSSLTAVRGNNRKLFVTSRDGKLYTFDKSWPLQFEQAEQLSEYGLNGLELIGGKVYVAKGQATITALSDRIYVYALNPGDFVLELPSMKTYGETFEPGRLLAFDRETQQPVGAIINNTYGAIIANAWQDLIFVTNPGCCGPGIGVYDSSAQSLLQFINRTTNTVAGTRRRGIPLLVGGSENGNVDLYMGDQDLYSLVSTANLPALTGFQGPEDIEIRSLWVDGIDDLIFAASSWGNDRSRGPMLPSFFVLEISDPPTPNSKERSDLRKNEGERISRGR
jgi:hypothetical protein